MYAIRSYYVNARETEPGAALKERIGGAQGAVVTASSVRAYEQAYRMVRPGGCMVMIGLSDGELKIPIYDTVINRITSYNVCYTKLLRQGAAEAEAGGQTPPQVSGA